MSDFKGHLYGGLAAAGIFLALLLVVQLIFTPLSWLELPVLILLCLFGAFWPDSDIGSKSQTVVYTVFFILDILLIFWLQYYEEAAILGLFTMLPALSKHRGWTHNPLWAVVVGLPLLIPPVILGERFLVDTGVHLHRNLIFSGVPYFLAFESGVVSHLLLDKLAFFKRRRGKAAKQRSAPRPGTLSGALLNTHHIPAPEEPKKSRSGRAGKTPRKTTKPASRRKK